MDTLPTNRFDVIVVGAGPAGVTAAMSLGRSGFSVLLCEAGIFPGAENWSGAVYFAENLERREAFGPDRIEKAPYERRVVERGAYLYNGHGLLGASLHGPDVFRSCYTVLRPVYDRYLAEVAREQGVVLACETTVQSLIRHRGRVVGVHTERGPAYADVVFLAEGDASHLVTQEGYERVTEEEHGEGAPHFLQGVKEVVSLDPRLIEERLGLAEGEGGAYEMLLRNATRKGRTVRLNMGGFLYTNRDSISLGFVLPLDNLKRHFQGDHNLLMEWFKDLPEIARLIDGGELTSYGAKIIRGGGYREIPQLVDDGLAIGGAASGVGIDFPYPNFTGPATAMGLYFAQAVRAIAEENGGPGRQGDPTRSPYTARQLQRTYLRTLQSSHYWRNVEYLRDWPGYVERTQFFFEKQLDLLNNTAYLSSRPDRSAPKRWWQVVRAVRRSIPAKRWGETLREPLDLARTVDGGRLVRAAITPGNVGRVLWNTVGALLPLRSDARIGASGELPELSDTGVAEATAPDGSRLRAVFRVGAGEEDPGRPPLLFRWMWKRYGGALAAAFSEVYTNDDTDIGRKLESAAVHVGGRFSVWDLVVKALGGVAFGVTAALQAGVEWFQLRVLHKELSEFRQEPANRLVEDNRERIRLDEDRVPVHTPYETKLGTITYREGTTSHIKVMWPEDLSARQSLADSSLWSVCPAKVYEVRRSSTGAPGVVVNFDNCIKCETCWRATDDVHWSRATQQRLIYQTYTPTQRELHDYLLSRPEPQPRLRRGDGFWEAVSSSFGAGPAPETASLGAAARETVTPEADADVDALDGARIAALQARLDRIVALLNSYTADLARSPMALEEGRRAHLSDLLAAAEAAFREARQVWSDPRAEALRDAAGPFVASLWEDADGRLQEMRTHADAERFFWADVLGRQLQDHHLHGLAEALRELTTRAGEVDAADVDGLDQWNDILAWRRAEASRDELRDARSEVRDRCEALFGSQEIRALEEGESLSEEQLEWLRGQVREAVEDDRAAAFLRRDLLIEELAGRDPSLAFAVASHLLAVDLLKAAGVEAGDEVRATSRWAAVVQQGELDARREGGDAVLSGSCLFVPTALADELLVVVGERGYRIPVDADGVHLDDVGSVGLLGAAPRRVRLRDCRVGGDATVDLAAAVDEVSLARPAAGAPCAGLLRVGHRDLVTTVRGAAEYLLDRSRDHAAGRVQFPDTFEDEAGRDTIAKFGAVKQMLAEMEAHRYQLEAVALRRPDRGDAWLSAAVAKVLASDAFGPADGSLTYNAGQIFGGTAFSEDDVIAKFYRDSAPYRFLLAHDDALRVEVGRLRLAAVADGDALIPVAEPDEGWLGRAAELALLAEITDRFESGREAVEKWARGLADSGDEVSEPVLALVGEAVVRGLGLQACLLRTVIRIEAGIPTEAVLEATRLLADRWAAEAPGIVDQADLAAATLAAGDDLLEHGEPFPAPAIADAESYDAIVEDDRSHRSGEYLPAAFDADHLRYVPEILSNEDSLIGYWRSLEEELRARFVEPRFDGLTYNRYLEKLHKIPDEDLDYLVDRGFMRMPIADEHGGEGALKAQYYILCKLMGRYGDAALSLAIMGNTSIGTTPAQIGLYQDLPRAESELQEVRDDPERLGEIEAGIDRLLAATRRPDLQQLTEDYRQLADLVKKRIARSSVLKYIGGGFLRAFFAAGQAGQRRDLDGFVDELRRARELLDGILEGVEERLGEYPRRRRAHELFLRMISAGYVSAFALTEPTAGSDSGGVKTQATLARRRVHRDDDGVPFFYLDEEGARERRNLVDADRLEFDFDGHRLLYRHDEDAEPAVIDHSGYDYEKDAPERTRTYMHGDREVSFTDIAQIREGDDGEPYYEYWVLNGAKMWITNGRFCQCMALYARTEPEGVTGFMVDRHAEGLIVGADEEKLGQRGSPTNELSLNNVRVPRESVIGFEGRGQVNALETLNTGRAGLAVTTHATIQEMLEDALPYLRGESDPRFDYEPRDTARPLERFWMGRLAEELVATAGTTYELVGLLDSKNAESPRMESAIGKYYGSEAEHEVIDWMERVRGLDGQTWLHRIEKTRRDARVLNIYEGTNEVQRFLLLKDLVQRVLPRWQESTRSDREPAYPEAVEQLEEAKGRLRRHLQSAVDRLDQLVWANVGLQPCTFRLPEIAGLVKVLDAVLYRLEWCARHQVPEEYGNRIELQALAFGRRAQARIRTLERRFEIAWEYVLEGRYPPEVHLGFLSLEADGAPREGWGEVPDRLLPEPPTEPLDRAVRILVPLKPVPAAAPRPRVADGHFVEPLYALADADAAALRTALQLRRRDPERVQVVAVTVAGLPGRAVLREAIARGADDAVQITPRSDDGSGPVVHDPGAVADALARILERRSADLVLCGAAAADTGQGALPGFLAGRLGWRSLDEVESLAWTPGATPELRVGCAGWQGERLEMGLPCILAVEPEEHVPSAVDLDAWIRAQARELEQVDVERLGGSYPPLKVRHVRRQMGDGGGGGEAATTPEAAAKVLVDLAGEAGGGGGADAAPYGERLLSLGEQPHEEEPSCVFVAEPVSGESLSGAARGDLEAASRIALATDLPLDVFLPVTEVDEEALRGLVGAVSAAAEPRRVYAIRRDGIAQFASGGHLEWLEELWAMYRGRPRWLMGPAWANELFARFLAGARSRGEGNSAAAWFNVEAVSNGGGGVRAATGIYGGGAQAEAELPDGVLRAVTFARSVAVELGDGTYAIPGSGATEAYLWEPRVEYRPEDDPVAALLARLGGGELTLEDAEYVIDFGYGAGGRDGLDELAEPLRELLSEELGLPKVMIGATRKVTQDLELLPMDRQIGQTGVTVNPKLVIALAVSGAPQHIDYIGERATILAFNVDPDAPLMKLNEQRPRPEVHPITGDVWDAVPAFIEAVRERLRGS